MTNDNGTDNPSPAGRVNANVVDNLRAMLAAAERGELQEVLILGAGEQGFVLPKYNIIPEHFTVWVGELDVLKAWIIGLELSHRGDQAQAEQERRAKLLRPGDAGFRPPRGPRLNG